MVCSHDRPSRSQTSTDGVNVAVMSLFGSASVGSLNTFVSTPKLVSSKRGDTLSGPIRMRYRRRIRSLIRLCKSVHRRQQRRHEDQNEECVSQQVVGADTRETRVRVVSVAGRSETRRRVASR